MKNLEERITEVSHYLQRLMEPAVFPDVQNAVEKKDKNSLIAICRKIKIPEIYVALMVSVLLSVGPEQGKWPYPQW